VSHDRVLGDASTPSFRCCVLADQSEASRKELQSRYMETASRIEEVLAKESKAHEEKVAVLQVRLKAAPLVIPPQLVPRALVIALALSFAPSP
jgi:hypothetical protein